MSNAREKPRVKVWKAWAWLTSKGRLYQIAHPTKWSRMEQEFFGNFSSDNDERPIRVEIREIPPARKPRAKGKS